MFPTLLRRVARTDHIGEAAERGSLAVIIRILKEHGPCTKHVLWKHAEEAGVKSLRHTKMMLQWLRKQNEVLVKPMPKSPEPQDAKELERPKSPSKGKGKKQSVPDREFVFSISPTARHYAPEMKAEDGNKS